MQTEINEITVNTRKILRPKLRKYPKLHKFTIFLYSVYSSLTGFAHVLPDFYIIGAAKCGTTALYDYLLQHPDFQPCVTKEPRFFDKYYQRGLNWYRIAFPTKIQKFFVTKLLHKKFITGEATPRYLDHPHAPTRIKQVTPNAKFIILLRNPIDRAYSNYNMRVNARRENLSFEDAIEQEPERTKDEWKKMLNDEFYYSRDYYHHSYLDRSIYVDKIKRWMEVFPKEQFLIIQSEEFLQDPSKVYNQVLEFLNLPKHELSNYKKEGAKYKSNLNPNIRKKLVEYFKPHNQRLYDFLGRKFDWDK